MTKMVLALIQMVISFNDSYERKGGWNGNTCQTSSWKGPLFHPPTPPPLWRIIMKEGEHAKSMIYSPNILKSEAIKDSPQGGCLANILFVWIKCSWYLLIFLLNHFFLKKPIFRLFTGTWSRKTSWSRNLASSNSVTLGKSCFRCSPWKGKKVFEFS